MTVRGKAASGENSVFARAAIGKQRVGLFGQRGKDEDMRHRASLAARAPITSGLADASPPWCCRLSASIMDRDLSGPQRAWRLNHRSEDPRVGHAGVSTA